MKYLRFNVKGLSIDTTCKPPGFCQTILLIRFYLLLIKQKVRATTCLWWRFCVSRTAPGQIPLNYSSSHPDHVLVNRPPTPHSLHHLWEDRGSPISSKALSLFLSKRLESPTTAGVGLESSVLSMGCQDVICAPSRPASLFYIAIRFRVNPTIFGICSWKWFSAKYMNFRNFLCFRDFGVF